MILRCHIPFKQHYVVIWCDSAHFFSPIIGEYKTLQVSVTTFQIKSRKTEQ